MDLTHNHPSIYYADGNLAIRCRSKDGIPTYFRIHRNYLSSYSTIIDDMLGVPPPSSGLELHDDVPVVDFDAKPEDMTTFLQFFYQPVTDMLSSKDPDVAFKLFEVLKLADMLFVESLKKMIISRVQDDWPGQTTLQEWIARNEKYSKQGIHRWDERDRRFPEPASVLRLARRFEPSLATPFLLYDLSFRHPSALYEDKKPLNPHVLAARWELVPLEERALIGECRDKILQFTTDGLEFILDRMHCSNEDHQCSSQWPFRISRMQTSLIHGCDPLGVLTLFLLDGERGDLVYIDAERGAEYYEDVLCESCTRDWDHRVRELRDSVFEKVDLWYRV